MPTMKSRKSSRVPDSDTWSGIPPFVKKTAFSLVGLAVPAIAVMLMVPFYLPSALVTGVVLSGAGYVFWIAYKRRSIPLAAASMAIMLVAAVWAFFSPLVLIPRPLYVFIDADRGPWNSETTRFSRTAPGNLLIISDPIRRALFPRLLAQLGNDDIRMLRTEKVEGKRYLRFPFSSALSYSNRAIAGTQDTLVLLPMVMTGLAVNADPGPAHGSASQDEGRALRVEMTPYVYNLIEFRQTTSLGKSRWNLVGADDLSRDLIAYVADLDNALFELSQGKAHAGATMLEALVADNRMPDKVEELRVASLLASLYRGMLLGSMGGLQPLVQNHRAYALLSPKLALSVPLDPVETWAALEIAAKYREYGPVFAQRVAGLEQRAIQSARPSSAEEPVPTHEKYRWKDAKTLWAAIEADEDFHLPGSLQFQVQHLAGLNARALKKEVDALADANTRAATISLALDSLASNLPAQELESRLAVLLNQAHQLPKRYAAAIETQIRLTAGYKRAIRLMLDGKSANPFDYLSGQLGDTCAGVFPRLTATFRALGSDQEKLLHRLREEGVVAPPDKVPWWSAPYLDWYGYQLLKFLVKLDRGGLDVAFVATVGSYSRMVADADARPFAPGMAAVAMVTANQKSKIGNGLRTTLDELLEAPTDTLMRASLERQTSNGTRRANLTNRPLF
jgi:hypothetical protein